MIARVVSNDEKGREKEVIYRSFRSYVPATALNIYDGSGKVAVNYYRIDDGPDGTLQKTLYYYNKQGQLTRSVSFDYKRRLRKDVDKGYGRPGGCVILPEDYEKNKSWALAAVWNYTYDSRGKLIEKFAPVFYSDQDHYLYRYDTAGRLIEERSLEGKRLIWIERYKYWQNGYEFTRTWYEPDRTRLKIL